MTEKQIIRKLNKAGIPLEGLLIERERIEIQCGYKEICSFGVPYGECDEDKVEEVKKLIQKEIPEFNGGSYTQYGAFILKENFVSMGDWNDPSSKWHY